MNLFGKSPQERAMESLIHDTNGNLGQITNYTTFIKIWLNSNVKALEAAGINTSELYRDIEYLLTSKRALQNNIDKYYVKFKNDFKSEEHANN